MGIPYCGGCIVTCLSFPFGLSQGGGIATTDSYNELVRGQVIDALMTNQGERVFRPRYGCGIQSALFDPSDELVRKDAASQIRNRLESLVVRCLTKSVTVELDFDPSVVLITIVYRTSLYALDSTVTVPVSSSDFIRQQALLLTGGTDS